MSKEGAASDAGRSIIRLWAGTRVYVPTVVHCVAIHQSAKDSVVARSATSLHEKLHSEASKVHVLLRLLLTPPRLWISACVSL